MAVFWGAGTPMPLYFSIFHYIISLYIREIFLKYPKIIMILIIKKPKKKNGYNLNIDYYFFWGEGE